MMSKVYIDFETFSKLDVRQVGAFKYAEHPSTEVLICCWAINDGPVQSWHNGLPFVLLHPLIKAVASAAKVGAHNAHFEFVIWNIVLRRMFEKLHKEYGALFPKSKHIPLPVMRPEQLDCTAARAAMCSLPRSLEKSAEVLGLTMQKDKRGGELIRFFCKPRKPTNRDPSTRNTPRNYPEKFFEFVRYCQQDVRTERGLDDVLPPLPPFERRVYAVDTRINTRGLPIDVELVEKATVIVDELTKRVKARVNTITNGINPTQRDRMLEWFERNGVELENLQAGTIAALLKNTQITLSSQIRTLLELRVEAAKASVKKLVSMARCTMNDGHARGTVLYYGAHTGRWAGRLIQPQNYIRGLLELAEQVLVFKLLDSGDADLFEALYEKPLYTIAQVMRGFIRAKRGHRLLVVDYAQIEARVLAWLAQEYTALDAYRRGEDRYVLMAAFLWNIPKEQVTKEQRRIAKNLVLGCGYGLGGAKFIEYCAKQDLIIDEDLSFRAVRAYRKLNPKTVEFWGDVERCAIAAVRTPGVVVRLRNLGFVIRGKFLQILLPSGRALYYPFAKLEPVMKFGEPSVQLTYRTEYFRAWIRTSTYGGKLVENIVQALARDIMCFGIWECEDNGYPIIGTVHDELISMLKYGVGSIKKMVEVISRIPAWAQGCPITAEGFEAERYRKG